MDSTFRVALIKGAIAALFIIADWFKWKDENANFEAATNFTRTS